MSSDVMAARFAGAAVVVLALLGLAGSANAIEPVKAAAIFQQAKEICDRDGGAFWGRSLCGPILLVEPQDRSIVANQADPGGVLKPSAPVFVGVLPETVNVANTPVEWSGTRWTQLIWPPPDDSAKLAHELFHRIQPDVPVAQPKGGDNPHLDTLEGRYLLQLEWRALAAALTASDAPSRKVAVTDALLFRAKRYALFAAAAVDERALELNEGVAEYTGVRLGLTSPQAQLAYALSDLKPYVPGATFVRSFAYATGPSYGLLLDRVDPYWRRGLSTGQGLDQLLRAAMRLPASDLAALPVRTAVYDDDGALRAGEVRRDAAMQARTAALVAKLVAGPVLILPLKHASYEFNPQTLRPLQTLGTVYPTMRVVDDWGVIQVKGDALMSADKATLTVSAQSIEASGSKGAGWSLTLDPRWTMRPGGRPGDFVIGPIAGGLP